MGAILKASPLKDASQVRSFVQLVQYSAKFHPNFAQEAEPLRSLVVYGKANIGDALLRLNQCEPKDTSGEEFDFFKAVAEESLLVALTVKQVELASDSDPEIASLRHYILSGDWS